MLSQLLYLRNQQGNLAQHLERLRKCPLQQFAERDLHHKTAQRALGIPIDIATNAMFAYDIFPPRILNALPQWRAEGRTIQTGDVIAQQINIPPVAGLSFRLICGVRILDVIDEPTVKQFSYATLTEHVETGRAVFRLEAAAGGVRFTIESWSLPAAWLPHRLWPMLSWYQDWCTARALENWELRFGAPKKEL